MLTITMTDMMVSVGWVGWKDNSADLDLFAAIYTFQFVFYLWDHFSPLGIIIKQADPASFRSSLSLSIMRPWFSIIYSIRRVFSVVSFLFLVVSVTWARVASSSWFFLPALMLLLFGVAAITATTLTTSALLLVLAAMMLRLREWPATFTSTWLLTVI